MKVRAIAGLGMMLLAAGLLLMFFLGDSGNDTPVPADHDPAGTVPRAAPLEQGGPAEVDSFLVDHNRNFRRLWSVHETAAWALLTGPDPAAREAFLASARELIELTGGRSTVEKLRLLRGRLDLTDRQDRQVEHAWRLAARYPAVAGTAVTDLINLERGLADSLATFRYPLQSDDQTVTGARLDGILHESRDLQLRRTAWEAAHLPGPLLKDGLVQVRQLRNSMAREIGYPSFFDLEAAAYGLDGADFLQLMQELLDGIMPLYRQLHCWVRHELAARYAVQDVPRLIPAHWLAERWGRSWPTVVQPSEPEGMFQDVQPRWIANQAERFFTSLGWSPLPAAFWENSVLRSPGAEIETTSPPAVMHLDLDQDVRVIMNLRGDLDSFQTAHSQVGRAYYCLAYSRDEVPFLLRRGPSPALPPGMGGLARLASGQVPYLRQVGLLASGQAPEPILQLLAEALTGPVVRIPFACGTLAAWEHDLYAEELPRHNFNTRWWEYAARFQGIAPAEPRTESQCDPATLAQLFTDPGQEYERALGALITFQLHRYICGEILEQDIHGANYYGNLQVGRYLDSITRLGATRNWDLIIRQATGRDLGSSALLEYFAPLQQWLETQNQGRQVDFSAQGG